MHWYCCHHPLELWNLFVKWDGCRSSVLDYIYCLCCIGSDWGRLLLAKHAQMSLEAFPLIRNNDKNYCINFIRSSPTFKALLTLLFAGDWNKNKEESAIIIFYNDGSNALGARGTREYNRNSPGQSLQKLQHPPQKTQSPRRHLQQDRNPNSGWSDYNTKSN